MKKILRIPLAIIALLTLTLTACNKDDVEPNAGEFKVRMTDAPADYVALQIEVISVDAYHETKGWISLSSETQTFDVLKLTNGKEIELALAKDIKFGNYTKLKILFGTDNALTFSNEVVVGGVSTYTNVTTDLLLEQNEEVIIEIDEEISGKMGANILLDFDAAKSVINTGSDYVLKPTIKMVKNETTGIEGEVQGATSALIVVKSGEKEFRTYINAQGKFLVKGLEQGTYDIDIFPSGQDVLDGAVSELTVENVFVAEGEIATINTVNVNG